MAISREPRESVSSPQPVPGERLLDALVGEEWRLLRTDHAANRVEPVGAEVPAEPGADHGQDDDGYHDDPGAALHGPDGGRGAGRRRWMEGEFPVNGYLGECCCAGRPGSSILTRWKPTGDRY